MEKIAKKSKGGDINIILSTHLEAQYKFYTIPCSRCGTCVHLSYFRLMISGLISFKNFVPAADVLLTYAFVILYACVSLCSTSAECKYVVTIGESLKLSNNSLSEHNYIFTVFLRF